MSNTNIQTKYTKETCKNEQIQIREHNVKKGINKKKNDLNIILVSITSVLKECRVYVGRPREVYNTAAVKTIEKQHRKQIPYCFIQSEQIFFLFCLLGFHCFYFITILTGITSQ